MRRLGSFLPDPPFRRLCAATLLSLTGSEISRVGLVLYLVQAGDSVAHLAWLVTLKTLPGVLLAPAVGLLVDRCRKDTVLVACEAARALLLVALLARPTLGMIYLVAVLDSVAGAFVEPARAACLPLIVRRHDLPRANGLMRGAASATLVLGPVLGAELFVRFGLAVTLALDAISYLLSAALVVSLQPRVEGSRGVPAALSLGGFWDNWSEVAAQPLVRQLALLASLSMLCGGLWMPLAPFFIRDVLGDSERLLGWQMGAFGLGGVLGGVLAGVSARVLRGGLLLWLFFAEALHVVAYALVANATLSTLILVSWGATLSLIGAGTSSLLQASLPPDRLGRAFALLQQGENASLLVAMVVAATLGERTGAPVLFAAAGATYAAVVALCWLRRLAKALKLAA